MGFKLNLPTTITRCIWSCFLRVYRSLQLSVPLFLPLSPPLSPLWTLPCLSTALHTLKRWSREMGIVYNGCERVCQYAWLVSSASLAITLLRERATRSWAHLLRGNGQMCQRESCAQNIHFLDG